MAKIAVAGHLCVDLKPTLPALVIEPGHLVEVGPLAVLTGGSVANTGHTLAWLGAEVIAFAAVGDDPLGRLLAAQFEDERFKMRANFVADVGTSYSIIVEPAGVDRTFWHHPGSNVAFDVDCVCLDDVDILHVGYPPLVPPLWTDGGVALAGLMRRAKDAGVVTSLDLAYVDRSKPVGHADWEGLFRRCLPHVDIVTPSYDDVATALGADERFDDAAWRGFAEQFLEWGAAVVMISAGEHGVCLAAADADRLAPLAGIGVDPRTWAGARATKPARPLTTQVTTTGAGDAASAAVLFALRNGAQPAQTLDFATRVSASVIESGGPNHLTKTPPELYPKEC